MTELDPAPARRRWPLALPIAGLALLVVAWSAFWYYAAHRAEADIAAWRAREAQAARLHTCAREAIGGYPFRIEVRCGDPALELRALDPPLALAAKDAVLAAQVYDPRLVIGEVSGPLTVGAPGQPATLTATWTLAQASLRGAPSSPERASLVFDKPLLARLDRGMPAPLAAAEHLELHARMAGAADSSAVEIALRLKGATATLHPALAQPTDGEIAVVVTGLKEFAPARLRAFQAAGGRLDIQRARLTQGAIVVAGAGTLALSASGRLDGQVRLTVVGLDRLVALLGVDQAVAQYLAQKSGGLTVDRLASGLDRLMPGLGGAVRGGSGARIAAAGITLLGEPAELDGQRAVALPLRFVDGAVYLGPILVGHAAPLF